MVDAVSGCVMLIRREVFERIGLLDEAYFFSFEDVDFCLRARDAASEIACVQDARAYHEGGRDDRPAIAEARYTSGPATTFAWLRASGRRSSRPLRLGLVAGFNAAYVLVSPESPLIGGARARSSAAMWDHAIGRYGAG